MRLIRRLIVLGIVAVGGVTAFNYVSDNGWPLRPHAAGLNAEAAKEHARGLANQAASKASRAAGQLGDTMSEGALTAKITSKMALDDYVNARSIAVDTSGSVVTVSGVVASTDERQRAVGLARDTKGVTQVIDKLQIRKP